MRGTGNASGFCVVVLISWSIDVSREKWKRNWSVVAWHFPRHIRDSPVREFRRKAQLPSRVTFVHNIAILHPTNNRHVELYE